MDEQIKNQRAIEALRNGVPNRDAVAALGCNQPEIEAAFCAQLDKTKNTISGNGENEGMLVAGDLGSGKSHLLEYLMHLALEQNFVCSKIVISKETLLFDPIKVFRAAVESAIVPGKRGNAIDEIVETLRNNEEGYADLFEWVHQQSGLHETFAATLYLYEKVKDAEFRNRIVRYWSGDPVNIHDIREYLREYGQAMSYHFDSISAKERSLQRLTFISHLIAAAGYSGWVLLFDEVELIGRYSLLQRARSYAEIARWMGKLEKQNIAGLASVLAITADFQSSILVEKDDFNNVPNKLSSKGKDSEIILAGQAEKGMKAIREDLRLIQAPDESTLKETYEKVKSIHARAYHWDPPPVPVRPTGSLVSTRMRQYIKGWITEWDLKRIDSQYQPDIIKDDIKTNYKEDENLAAETDESADSDGSNQ